MKVNVEVSGQLLPGKPRRQTLTVEFAATVQDVATLLGLVPEEVGLVTVNGVQSEMDDPVPPNARLCFFPHLSGG